MKKHHWTSLVTSLRYGQCILVLGPEIPAAPLQEAAAIDGGGISYANAITQHLVFELEEDDRRVKGKTLAAVAQQYEDADGFGPNALRASAADFYRSGTYGLSEVHRALAQLPFSLILTTCHDNLLTRSLQEYGKEPIVQRYNLRGDKRDNPEFELPGSPNTPVIYHLFGNAQEPGSLVLSENDLLDFLIGIVSERPPLPNSLKSILKRNGQSFLFVGFGIKHWHLRIPLKVLIRAFGLHRNGSWIATEALRDLDELDREQTILFYERGPRIEVEDADASVFLTKLSCRLEAEGGFAGVTSSIGQPPRVFISYAREDSEIAGRVFDTLQRSQFEPWVDRKLEGGDNWDQRIRDELEATDYTLLLYTPALCRKTDSYVNKEIALARNRALNVRGSFLIPLRTDEITPEERIGELRDYQEMELRPAHLDQDLAKVMSVMKRDYQRRNRDRT
jgi:hypothetical protein